MIYALCLCLTAALIVSRVLARLGRLRLADENELQASRLQVANNVINAERMLHKELRAERDGLRAELAAKANTVAVAPKWETWHKSGNWPSFREREEAGDPWVSTLNQLRKELSALQNHERTISDLRTKQNALVTEMHYVSGAMLKSEKVAEELRFRLKRRDVRIRVLEAEAVLYGRKPPVARFATPKGWDAWDDKKQNKWLLDNMKPLLAAHPPYPLGRPPEDDKSQSKPSTRKAKAKK
jgi:hypothetical protein